MDGIKLIALCGAGGAGKDTFYEQVLQPRGFIRWQITLHYKVWLASTGRYDWDDIFHNKPPEVRKVLQEEITALRYEHSEDIWLNTFKSWMRAMHEIVGLHVPGIAVTDMRFLAEMRGIKAMGGKLVHIEAADTNIPVEMRGHRSETELQSPEMRILRDSYIFNEKNGLDRLKYKGNLVLQDWGWI